MQKLGVPIQHLEEPQPPDQFVVGVLENNGYKKIRSNRPPKGGLKKSVQGRIKAVAFSLDEREKPDFSVAAQQLSTRARPRLER